jgi:hypothetical protein
MQPRQCTHYLQMAQLLGPNVHEQILTSRILAIEALDRILHRSSELTIGAAELLQQHVAKLWVGLIDANRIHQLLDVVIHWGPF